METDHSTWGRQITDNSEIRAADMAQPICRGARCTLLRGSVYTRRTMRLIMKNLLIVNIS